MYIIFNAIISNFGGLHEPQQDGIINIIRALQYMYTGIIIYACMYMYIYCV